MYKPLICHSATWCLPVRLVGQGAPDPPSCATDVEAARLGAALAVADDPRPHMSPGTGTTGRQPVRRGHELTVGMRLLGMVHGGAVHERTTQDGRPIRSQRPRSSVPPASLFERSSMPRTVSRTNGEEWTRRAASRSA